MRTLLLRTRQVDLVNACVHAVEGAGHWAVKKGSLVKQMIMGQGKTTVVSPLICLMLAQGEYLGASTRLQPAEPLAAAAEP